MLQRKVFSDLWLIFVTLKSMGKMEMEECIYWCSKIYNHMTTFFAFLTLNMSLFYLSLGPNDRGLAFEVVTLATVYLPVPGFELTSSVFRRECGTN